MEFGKITGDSGAVCGGTWLTQRTCSTRPSFLLEMSEIIGQLQVIPGLFVGNLADSKDLLQLEQNHISHIVSVYDNARRIFKVKEYVYVKGMMLSL